mmetsp:Transcript_52706/g.112488  ORF Transcript_52706/g.112488 Transcript_52706/m.112488 type:complete len:208 (+) Transcript_52706:716-1339(+)
MHPESASSAIPTGWALRGLSQSCRQARRHPRQEGMLVPLRQVAAPRPCSQWRIWPAMWPTCPARSCRIQRRFRQGWAMSAHDTKPRLPREVGIREQAPTCARPDMHWQRFQSSVWCLGWMETRGRWPARHQRAGLPRPAAEGFREEHSDEMGKPRPRRLPSPRLRKSLPRSLGSERGRPQWTRRAGGLWLRKSSLVHWAVVPPRSVA